MGDADAAIAELSERHRFSVEAVRALVGAMRRGGGIAAQFSHSELGGMGQRSSGGMLMIGDMFNATLKERVARLCDDVARHIADGRLPRDEAHGDTTHASLGAWWPDEFGQPASSGAQDDMRYAFFPVPRRLAIRRGDRLELYDTGEHQLSGFSQSQSAGQSVIFTSQHGPVRIEHLRRVDRDEMPGQPNMPAQAGREDSYNGLERLHELHRKGVLTEGEFMAKKQELLARI